MTDLLEVDRRPFLMSHPARRRTSRRKRWVLWIAAGALFAAVLGYLIPDQVQARDRVRRGPTRRSASRASRPAPRRAQLDEVRRDLSILKTQVGSDSTALSQDSSQLLGAQTSLAAAKAHVSQQALLIPHCRTCLVGVEQALNELAVGKQASAIAALNSVSASCTAAEASSG